MTVAVVNYINHSPVNNALHQLACRQLLGVVSAVGHKASFSCRECSGRAVRRPVAFTSIGKSIDRSGEIVATILKFPIERTLAAALERRRSHRIDVAIAEAEEWQRVCRVSKLLDAYDTEFRRDQAPNNFTDNVHRLRLPLPGKC